jgi:5-methylcytosine-specific restriction endonuclease McrA
MTRPPGVCPHPGCPELIPPGSRGCPTHARPAWHNHRDSSDHRRGISGSAWQKLRRDTLRTHRGICHVCGNPGADQVDHLVPLYLGGTHEPTNLRPVHARPCHLQRSQQQARDARHRTHQGEGPPPPGR